MKTLLLTLVLSAMAFAIVGDDTPYYSDCSYFNNLIAMPLGGDDSSYLTFIGTGHGVGTYNVVCPNDRWTGSMDGYNVLVICFAAAGVVSESTTWSSDNCNVVFSNAMITMSTYNCRAMVQLEGCTDQYLKSWIDSHASLEWVGWDDIQGAYGY